jgi:hypothetical protein
MGKSEGERRRPPSRERVESTESRRIFTTLGAEASERWLVALGLAAVPHWSAEIAILADDDSRFDLNIYGEEWGFVFHHGGKTSWIRVTDLAFVHGRDDFGLLGRTPELFAIAFLLVELEAEHHIAFRRATASVRTNIPGAANTIRDWLLEPLPHTTVRTTVELCGNETHHGVRCTLGDGHGGEHEYLGHDGTSLLHWK